MSRTLTRSITIRTEGKKRAASNVSIDMSTTRWLRVTNGVMRCAAAIAVTAIMPAAPAARQAAEDLGGLPRQGNRPLERIDGAQIRYGAVPGPDGIRLRTIATRPIGASSRLPAVFVVGWLSCDSVESPPQPAGADGIGRTLHAVAAQSGLVTFRVDKPGAGDSEGNCAETDFATELAAYRRAYRAFTRHEWVDPARVIVMGLSNGGGFAPLVPDGDQVAAYITSGGWSKTWLEHMLEHERRRMTLSGLSDAVATERMRGYATFYDRYLNAAETPATVLKTLPHLGPLWYDEPAHQYGRPASFYQQLQALNLLAAWERVTVPVLAVWGEYDWIMSRGDVALIVDTVNRGRPGRAELVEIPKMGHSHQVFDSLADAFTFRSPRFETAVVDAILGFLKRVSG